MQIYEIFFNKNSFYKKSPTQRWGFLTYSSVSWVFLFNVINLSIDAIPKHAMVRILNESKMNSLTNNGLPIAPVIMSTIANEHIITNDMNPMTAFSLIELWSLNNSLKNFFIVSWFYLSINILNKSKKITISLGLFNHFQISLQRIDGGIE
jgi:hypothetical protein